MSNSTGSSIDWEGMSLPFDNAKQYAILWHLRTDKTFFLAAQNKVKPNWFNDANAGKAYKALLDFFEDYGRQPTLEEWRACDTILAEQLPEQKAILGTIEKARLAADTFGLDVLRGELTEWLHASIYVDGLARSSAAFRAQKFREAYRLMTERLRAIEDSRFESDGELSFDNWKTYLALSETQYQGALTTGCDVLDKLLMPEGVEGSGGLLPGDTTVLLAPSNIGKTTWVDTVLAVNLLRGKNCLWMPHEGRPEDLREKLLQALLGWTKSELFQMYKAPEMEEVLETVASLLRRHLVYIPYQHAGMTVEDVIPVIRRKADEFANRTGTGIDLLVDDYPANLLTQYAKGGQMPLRTLWGIVYGQFVNTCLELKCHGLLPIQTNRSGSIVNRDEDRLLALEDVSESWDVITRATSVIALNRPPSYAEAERAIYGVLKSRSNRTGRSVLVKSDFSRARAHWPDLPATWFRGDLNSGDQIDAYLNEYNGRELPGGPAKETQ